MAVHEKYHVIIDGEEIGVFDKKSEAEKVDAEAELAARLKSILVDCQEAHGMGEAELARVAQALATQSKALEALLKGKSPPRPKRSRSSKPEEKGEKGKSVSPTAAAGSPPASGDADAANGSSTGFSGPAPAVVANGSY